MMTMKRIAAVFGVCLASGGVASAATLAYDNTGANPSSSTSQLNIGREFTVSGTGITVYDLGVYDAGADGLVNPHDVTLFSINPPGSANPSNTPLATVTVPAGGGTLDGGFRFSPLATPLFLAAGNYAVIGYGLDTGPNGNGDPYGDGGGRLASANANDATFDPYAFTTATSPTFPTNGDSNDHASASFHFDPGNTVPEPASLGLLGVGGLGLLARRRRTA